MQKALTPLQRAQLEALGAPLDFPPEYISWLEEFTRLRIRNTNPADLPTGITTDAAHVSFVSAGDIASDNVQDAVEEVAADAAAATKTFGFIVAVSG